MLREMCGIVLCGLFRDSMKGLSEGCIMSLPLAIIFVMAVLAIHEAVHFGMKRSRPTRESWMGIVRRERCTGRRRRRCNSIKMLYVFLLGMIVTAECTNEKARAIGIRDHHDTGTDSWHTPRKGDVARDERNEDAYNTTLQALGSQLKDLEDGRHGAKEGDEGSMMQSLQYEWPRWFGPSTLNVIDQKTIKVRAWTLTGRRNRYMYPQFEKHTVSVVRDGNWVEQVTAEKEVRSSLEGEIHVKTVQCPRDIFDHRQHRAEVLVYERQHEYNWRFTPMLGDYHDDNLRFRAAAMVPAPEGSFYVSLLFDIFHERHQCESSKRCFAMIDNMNYDFDEEVHDLPGGYVKLIAEERNPAYAQSGSSSTCSTRDDNEEDEVELGEDEKEHGGQGYEGGGSNTSDHDPRKTTVEEEGHSLMQTGNRRAQKPQDHEGFMQSESDAIWLARGTGQGDIFAENRFVREHPSISTAGNYNEVLTRSPLSDEHRQELNGDVLTRSHSLIWNMTPKDGVLTRSDQNGLSHRDPQVLTWSPERTAFLLGQHGVLTRSHPLTATGEKRLTQALQGQERDGKTDSGEFWPEREIRRGENAEKNRLESAHPLSLKEGHDDEVLTRSPLFDEYRQELYGDVLTRSHSLSWNVLPKDGVLTRSHQHRLAQWNHRVLTWSPERTAFLSRQHDVLTRSHPLTATKREHTEVLTRSPPRIDYRQADTTKRVQAAGRFPDEVHSDTALEQSIRETRNADQRWRQNLRDEAARHTLIRGQEAITAEFLDLAEQRDDRQVRVHLHGLDETEIRVERLWIDTSQIRDFLDLLVILRGVWNDVRTSPEMALHFVSAQPSPVVYRGNAIITLLMDLSPRRRTVPFIIVSRFDQMEFDDTYDVASYRHEPFIDCLAIKEMTGLTMVCERNARCTCTHDHNRVEDGRHIPLHDGMMMMIHIFFDQLRCDQDVMEEAWVRDETASQEEAAEDQSLMQLGTTQNPQQPFEMPWLYGYGMNLVEPIRAWRAGSNGMQAIPFLASLYAGKMDRFLSWQVSGYRVFPQPRDIVRLSAEAFVLANRDEVNPGHSIILLDTTWEYQGPREMGTNLWNSDFSRGAKVVGHLMNRQEFFTHVGMSPICSNPEWLCILVLRGRPWMDDEQKHIMAGDYVELTLRRRPRSIAPDLPVPNEADCDRAESPERTRPRDQESRPSIDTERGSNTTSEETIETRSLDSRNNEHEESSMMHQNMEKRLRTSQPRFSVVFPHRLPEPIYIQGNMGGRRSLEIRASEEMRRFGVIVDNEEVILAAIQPQPDDLQRRDEFGYVAAPRKDVAIWQEIVLLDVNFELGTGTGHVEGNPWRTMRIIDYHIDLRTLHEQIGLAAFCGGREGRCQTALRKAPWPDIKIGADTERRLRGSYYH